MAIKYYEDECLFKLDSQSSSYLIKIADEKYAGHVYYGRKLRGLDAAELLRIKEPPFTPSVNERDKLPFLDTFSYEYPTGGVGDFRESAIEIRDQEGYEALELFYESYKIYEGKPGLTGLPAVFAEKDQCATLELRLRDSNLGLSVTLFYSVFEEIDAIIRSVHVHNTSQKDIYLTKVLSACIDMDNKDFELVTLHGSWARERHIQESKVCHGFQGVSSNRGESSHQYHPFFALKEGGATQETGEVYGMHFVYSGNFIANVSLDQFESVRAVMGIHPDHFCWKLEAGDTFQTPEVVLVYSSQGLGGMTRTYHDLYKNHLIRGEYKDKQRPVLINNWEATYFDFNSDKLISIAKEASELGIEMLVMDDGWFGNRYDDNRALGDWKVNEEKINKGLKSLVEEVNRLGMKFGIWFEPEMISPDSDLFREHPDWAIGIPGRTRGLCRNQYVLDLTRKEVLEHTYESVAGILRSANIEYVKWDMNRQLADLGSMGLPKDRQGELSHRYVLAVYELQERLLKEFPYLLLENCSGGGARFDPGMLYYSPQIWCSDDTDAIERLLIQEGTALIYPLSTIGAHVSDCPNHTVGRVTPFETRGYVALAGTFGYELDVTKIPEEDRKKIPEQIALYKKYNELIRTGDYYRIASYRTNHFYDCFQVVSKEKDEALVTYIQVLNRPNCHSRRIYLKGLDPNKNYKIEGEDRIYGGDTLMFAGLNLTKIAGDFKGFLIHLTAV